MLKPVPCSLFPTPTRSLIQNPKSKIQNLTVNLPILSSTFFLTLLLLVGLFFFVRASIKDRIQQAEFAAVGSEDWLLGQLQDYFQCRAYQVVGLDAAQNQVIFEGFVRPSWFLAIFLTVLAAVGLSCLALVLYLLFPAVSYWLLLLLLLPPAAGWFYWKGAGRVERVLLQVDSTGEGEGEPSLLIAVTAHRDELYQLKAALPFLRERGTGNGQ
jgi:hypothetical protein